jgi:hypothetical protein
MKVVSKLTKNVFLLLLILAACRPKINVEPALDIPDDRALNNIQDLQNALEGTYNALQNRHCLGGSFLLWGDILADGFKPFRSTPEEAIYRYQFNPADTLITKNWEWAYRTIGRANNIIFEIENNRSKYAGELDARNNLDRILGEALAIRAVVYFYLVRFYAPQYDASTLGEPAVPLKLSPPRVIENLPRASVLQVYTQIEKDLERAISLLNGVGFKRPISSSQIWPLSSGYRIFGNMSGDAAAAFLAKVHYQKGTPEGDAKALSLINSTIGLADSSMAQDPDGIINDRVTLYPRPNVLSSVGRSNINILYTWAGRGASFEDPLNPMFETLFQIMNNTANSQSYYLQRQYSFTPNTPARGFNNPSFTLSARFRDSLFRRYTDLRRRAGPGEITTETPGEVYINKFAWDVSLNLPIIRSADLMLMRADIYCRQGAPEKAIYDLAFVKARARILRQRPNNPVPLPVKYYYLSEWTFLRQFYTSANRQAAADSLLFEIDVERARELIAEGSRIHDLRRRRAFVFSGERGGDHLAWNDRRLILPIPITEQNTNRALSN